MKIVRYSQALRRLRSLSTDATILDVGSGASGLGTWWNRPFVGVDLSFEGPLAPHMRAVIADGGRLPFLDDRFDLVVCVDVLQEVPARRLQAVCRELLRVAAGTVVLVVACGPEAEAADRRLLDWCTSKQLTPPDWLPRQVRQGLPSAEAIREALDGHGRITEGRNRSVAWHERMVRAEIRPRLRLVRSAARPLLRFWGRRAPRDLPGGGENSYGRWFVVELERGC